MPGYRSLEGQEQKKERLADALNGLCRQYHLVALYVFGSRAAEIAARVRSEAPGSERPDSDVDIGVLPAREHCLSVKDRVSLAMTLEELFDVGRVDLVILPEAKPYLALDVVRGELLCVTDVDAEAAYQLYVLRRAADLAPLERERRRMVLAGEAI
jgi:predicted nucleotidyltransferase